MPEGAPTVVETIVTQSEWTISTVVHLTGLPGETVVVTHVDSHGAVGEAGRATVDEAGAATIEFSVPLIDYVFGNAWAAYLIGDAPSTTTTPVWAVVEP